MHDGIPRRVALPNLEKNVVAVACHSQRPDSLSVQRMQRPDLFPQFIFQAIC
jgi:hypothetical protein